ncbi:hypothetical protein PRIPAC_86304, partial [Pristionchus pacificus]
FRFFIMSVEAHRPWRRLIKIDENTYKGECDSEHAQARVYGGHVLAQATAAAYFTAPEGFYIHSIHCYFVRGGEEDEDITFKVTRVRDGRNFAVRYVEAQQHGKTIHLSEYSLQKIGAVNDDFKLMPKYPGTNLPHPDTLVSEVQGRHESILNGNDMRNMRGIETPRMAPSIDLRPTDIDLFLNGDSGRTTKQYLWMRYKNHVDPKDHLMHHGTIVYMSDMGLAATGSLCYDWKRFKLVTSLDHSAWFHDYEFNVNDWILYEQEVVSASTHRSLIQGRLWTIDGRLIMSTTQEALIYRAKQ